MTTTVEWASHPGKIDAMHDAVMDGATNAEIDEEGQYAEQVEYVQNVYSETVAVGCSKEFANVLHSEDAHTGCLDSIDDLQSFVT